MIINCTYPTISLTYSVKAFILRFNSVYRERFRPQVVITHQNPYAI